MLDDIIKNAEAVDWITVVISFGGLLLGIVALWLTSKANSTAKEANALAEKAVRMQEDEGKVRVVVKPRIMYIAGEEGRPRTIVEVINLSRFPVTIEKIWWRTKGKAGFYWKNPTIAHPFGPLPVRLPSRESMVAISNQEYPTDDQLLEVTAAVAMTACGEEIDGMTDDFREYVAKIRAGRQINGPVPN